MVVLVGFVHCAIWIGFVKSGHFTMGSEFQIIVCCLILQSPWWMMFLNVVSKQRYLGLIFDDQLNWSYYDGKVCKSMLYYIYLISKHHHVIKADLLRTLTESLVLSRLLYSLPVWGTPLSQYYLQRLQQMQHCAVRLCKGLRKYNHVNHHYPTSIWASGSAS